MIRNILALSIAHRWTVVVISLVAAALGAWALWRLPIDAVPGSVPRPVVVTPG